MKTPNLDNQIERMENDKKKGINSTFLNERLNEYKSIKEQLTLTDVGSSFVEYEKQVSLNSIVLKDITDDGTVRGRYILDDGKLYKVELVEKFTLLDLK